MSKIRTREILSNLPLFSDMGPEDIERIAQCVQEIHAGRGQVLFHAGEVAQGFHVVVFGQVKLAFTSAKGVEKVVQLIGAGQSFGEAVMFLEKPYPLSAQTLADSLLLHIPKSAVADGIAQDTRFAHKMLAGLSMRLHGLIHDVEAYSLRSSAQRVIGYLLQHEDLEPPLPCIYLPARTSLRHASISRRKPSRASCTTLVAPISSAWKARMSPSWILKNCGHIVEPFWSLTRFHNLPA